MPRSSGLKRAGAAGHTAPPLLYFVPATLLYLSLLWDRLLRRTPLRPFS